MLGPNRRAAEEGLARLHEDANSSPLSPGPAVSRTTVSRGHCATDLAERCARAGVHVFAVGAMAAHASFAGHVRRTCPLATGPEFDTSTPLSGSGVGRSAARWNELLWPSFMSKAGQTVSGVLTLRYRRRLPSRVTRTPGSLLCCFNSNYRPVTFSPPSKRFFVGVLGHRNLAVFYSHSLQRLAECFSR